ncbi:MAG: hypothetical protein U9Q71_00105 [Pseudomonadota bacterium]|nr:hypothetical protein [Pseudomonadota bacterium]
MCKFCWGLVLVLVLVMAGAIYKFGFRGSVAPASDGRTAVQLTAGERDLVLVEMRAFLESVQAIVQALGSEEMPAVVQAARNVGMNAQQEVPASLVVKLPGALKKLGFDTHRKFDQLALDAEEFGDPKQSLEQLGELMQNCIGCHAAYKLVAVEEK